MGPKGLAGQSSAVSAEARESFADWLLLVAALSLLGSLFLTWSHQFSRVVLAQYGSSPLLRGVPPNPTAWQVYSTMDVVLALLAGALVAIALVGGRSARIVAFAACVIALPFALHALGDPPTNHATIFGPAIRVPGYLRDAPSAGVGETLAIAALVAALAGLGLSSFSADY